MVESIQQLVRYEIPGYICIVFAFLLLLPFINFQWLLKNTDFLQTLGIIVTVFISGIPLGWLLYQLHVTFWHNRDGKKAWDKPRRILQSWDKKHETSDAFRDHLMDYALVKTGLLSKAQACWAHATARTIVGIFVPFISPILAVSIFLLASLSPLSDAFSSDNVNINFLLTFVIWFILSAILFFSTYLKTKRIFKELEKYIIISILTVKEELEQLIETRKSIAI